MNDKPETCATIIQNYTKHVATLPTGNMGYIEVPIANEKTKYYQLHDINSLELNVAHTYHPEITEPIAPINYDPQYTEDTTYSPQVSMNQIYMTDSSITSTTPNSVYNVQHSSRNLKTSYLPFSSLH